VPDQDQPAPKERPKIRSKEFWLIPISSNGLGMNDNFARVCSRAAATGVLLSRKVRAVQLQESKAEIVRLVGDRRTPLWPRGLRCSMRAPTMSPVAIRCSPRLFTRCLGWRAWRGWCTSAHYARLHEFTASFALKGGVAGEQRSP
jgi:hypothetical protein